MTNKLYLMIIFSMILITGVVSAVEWPICIDMINPDAPTGLSAGGNLQLSWNVATDKPDCSGIAYYKIYKDNVLFVDRIKTNSYSGSALPEGTYTFDVLAVDKAGNLGVKATLIVTFPLSSPPVNPGNNENTGGNNNGGSNSGGSSTTTPITNTTQTQTTSTGTGSQESGDGEEETISTGTGTEKQKGFLSGLTGAVIGGGAGSIIGVIIFIAAITGISVYVYKRRKD